ncbi:MAG: glycosyltransferase family 2 protein [Clostridia bacterium]|nr:glycosyltransferase family 2 protein [Clostridia bacterium]
MEQKKVSIIVPVYRVEEFLERAVKSVQAQTHENFELILVDDCSPDGSGALCDRLAEGDARIRVIHKPQNQGAARARETGIAAATGEFIGFLDGDDYIDPDMYRTLLAAQQAHGADVVECSYYTTTDESDLPAAVGGAEHVTDRVGALALLHSVKAMHEVLWNKLFRRELLPQGEGEAVILGEDYSLLVRILSGCDKYVYIETPFCHYVQRESSVCNAGYSEKHRAALENWRAHRTRLSAEYPEIAGEITAKLLFNEMSVLAAMTKNKHYDKEVIRTVRRDVRANLRLALKSKSRTLMVTGSLLLVAISPRLLMLLYRVLFRQGRKSR